LPGNFIGNLIWRMYSQQLGFDVILIGLFNRPLDRRKESFIKFLDPLIFGTLAVLGIGHGLNRRIAWIHDVALVSEDQCVLLCEGGDLFLCQSRQAL
jgi:hypothetical protein